MCSALDIEDKILPICDDSFDHVSFDLANKNYFAIGRSKSIDGSIENQYCENKLSKKLIIRRQEPSKTAQLVNIDNKNSQYLLKPYFDSTDESLVKRSGELNNLVAQHECEQIGQFSPNKGLTQKNLNILAQQSLSINPDFVNDVNTIRILLFSYHSTLLLNKDYRNNFIEEINSEIDYGAASSK